jgi:hypothetical protein
VEPYPVIPGGMVEPVTLIHDCDLVISHVMNLSSLDQESLIT